jgi:hypothetical protein
MEQEMMKRVAVYGEERVGMDEGEGRRDRCVCFMEREASPSS